MFQLANVPSSRPLTLFGPGTLADIMQPRTFEDLERYGFSALPDEPLFPTRNLPPVSDDARKE